MAFRNVIIANPAHISLRSNQLIIKTDREHSLPIEDISALLIESNQSTITTAALSYLGQCGCAVFLCDSTHMPCAVISPLCQHSRGVSILKAQTSMTAAMKNRLWQQIVIAKIKNQAKCLSLRNHSKASGQLEDLSAKIRRGDPNNSEATAAQIYFPALFGSGFTRGSDCGYNAALNYGYAILRGCIARALSAYGFYPAIGLHHHSELNQFNLADDVIEPFRPAVDLFVSCCISEEDTLTPQIKQLLFNIPNLEIIVNHKKYAISYAIELVIQSLQRAMIKKETALSLPELQEIKQHTYE